MVIRRSAAAEVRDLIDRLVGGNDVEREAATARLAIIGSRAIRTLTAVLETAGPEGQAAILRTFEAIHDPRAFAPAVRLTDSADAAVASGAVSVLRRFLRHSDAPLANAAFERLTAVTLDPTRPEAVRAAALEALSDLPSDTTRQVLRQLQNDPSRCLRVAAATRANEATARPGGLADITEASACPEPAALRALIAAEGGRAPLAMLGRLVEMLRAREEAEAASPRRTEWQAARAAVHQVLARRGSRIALYDLREALAAAPGPLPVGFVAALEVIGDASCLDAIASAYVRARRARDAWWVEHLAALFVQVLRRERLTRRSPAVKRVIARWPQAADELLPRRKR